MSGAADRTEEPDEATRILQAGEVISPSGDVQAMQVAWPVEAEEERTTILLHPAPDDDEERTTIVHALPGAPDYAENALETDTAGSMAAPGDAQAIGQDMPGFPPAVSEHEASGGLDEPTAVLRFPAPEAGDGLVAQASGGAAAGWSDTAPATPDPGAQEAGLRGLDSWNAGDHADADEATTILTSPAHQDDEQTTILQHDLSRTEAAAATAGPGGDIPASWKGLVAPSPVRTAQPLQVPETGQAEAERSQTSVSHEADIQEATSIVPAAEPARGAADSTEILPAAALAGLPDGTAERDGQVSGRAWFDRRLRDFNHALLHTQTGERRPAAERQSLAAAARDMIQRVGLRDPEHKAADWADTVLQADQLLVNTYFVRALIARGGVGEIYRARHRDLKTEHAIKILLPRYALDPTVLNLMLEEARLLQRVRHEAVVGCQGLLRDTDGRPMLVMDYLRGRTLSARLRDGPLPPTELLRLAARLASGLSALHAQGLVHQDISPDNIILVDDNCAAATIIDFGLARSLDAPENTHRNIDFAGKFSWCSPEQLSSRATQVDARSDLYSLGLVLAAAARGTRLDMGSDLASARAARHSVPPLGSIQEPIATLLRHLLAPSAATRLRSAEEVPDWLRAKRPGFVQRLFGK